MEEKYLQTFSEAQRKAKMLAESVKMTKIEIPNQNVLYSWVNRDVIRESEFTEYSEKKKKLLGHWSHLLHFEIVTAANLRKGYKLTEVAEVGKILREPLETTGGVTGRYYNGKGFWKTEEVVKKVFRDYLGKDFEPRDYFELQDRPQFENRILFDYLEIHEFFERRATKMDSKEKVKM